MTHARRAKGTIGPRVSVAANLQLMSKKEHFLANCDNKQQFIDLLKVKLNEHRIKTASADGDADTMIAKTGVQLSTLGRTHVIGEDTDLLVLLCHYCSDESKGLIFRSDRKTAKSRVWDIDIVRRTLGTGLCHLLPVVHAIGGCDTTSRLFGVGKGIPVKKAQNDDYFKSQVQTLSNSKVTAVEVETAGERAIVSLYGGKKTETLADLRARKFTEKVASSATSVQAQSLPPTSDAVRIHSRRVYYQAQIWMGSELNPIDWGWRLADERLEPHRMDLMAAPEFLLKIIRCQLQR